jgi:hypothetical protein
MREQVKVVGVWWYSSGECVGGESWWWWWWCMVVVVMTTSICRQRDLAHLLYGSAAHSDGVCGGNDGDGGN